MDRAAQRSVGRRAARAAAMGAGDDFSYFVPPRARPEWAYLFKGTTQQMLGNYAPRMAPAFGKYRLAVADPSQPTGARAGTRARAACAHAARAHARARVRRRVDRRAPDARSGAERAGGAAHSAAPPPHTGTRGSRQLTPAPHAARPRAPIPRRARARPTPGKRPLTESEMADFERDHPELCPWLKEDSAESAGGWRAECKELLNDLLKRKESFFFRNPVDQAEVDYHSVVKCPMSLNEVRARG